MTDTEVCAGNGSAPDYDVIIVGAGFGGLGALHHIRQSGFKTVLLEAGDGVGGTWHWNRYPGARTDTEAWYYAFSFAPEQLTDYRWRERFPGWQEVNSYLTFAAERLDLNRSIELSTRVQSLVYDEPGNFWTVATTAGRTLTSRFVVTAMGGLSDPHVPEIPGRETFAGTTLLSARWPKEPVDFTDRRVAIIGTGATGVQLVPELASQAAELYVFQRTPNYVLAGNNRVISDEQWEEIKRTYPAIWQKAWKHYFAFPNELTNRTVASVVEDEREKIFEEMWAKGGFAFYRETFDDLAFDEGANEQAAEFIRRKIRETVADPDTAELLSPRTYPFGGKRPPIGHGYYESFNRPNVHLVDVSQTPISEITPTGLRAGSESFDVDVIIFATGFDALTGALTAIDIVGRDGVRLADVWSERIRTHTGLASSGFPNLLFVYGPQTPYANVPVSVEKAGQWITGVLEHMRENELDYIEAVEDAEEAWRKQMQQAVEATILVRDVSDSKPWFMGANIPGKPVEVQVFFGGFDRYHEITTDIAKSGYQGFVFK